MKETGIMFTPENHRAILGLRKTQTRRVAKLPTHFKCPVTHQKYPLPVDLWKSTTYGGHGTFRIVRGEKIAFPEASGMWNDKGATLIGPPWQVGERLYIKEGVIVHADGRTLAGYYMDGARVTNLGEKRLTAMFMPKPFARTWLEITDVRVQRVQDISEEDAIAEGVYSWSEMGPLDICARPLFRSLWNSINGKKHPWVNNDWVWAITFKVLGDVRG